MSDRFAVIIDDIGKISGPYSDRQAREVANNTIPGLRVRIVPFDSVTGATVVRPRYWLAENDDLPEFRHDEAMT